MAAAKLIVMYPMPKDMALFERAYSTEHIPMAAAIFQTAGAIKFYDMPCTSDSALVQLAQS